MHSDHIFESFGEHDPVKPDTSDVLTLELFVSRWGDKIDLEPTVVADIWRESRSRSANEEYHNFAHNLETTWAAMELADYCEENGVVVDRAALYMGSMLHDSLIDLDHEEMGFDSKEHLSAHINTEIGKMLGIPYGVTERGSQAILSTRAGMIPITNEDKALVRADLDNIGQDFDTFYAKTKLVWAEFVGRADQPMTDDFKQQTVLLLSLYLKNDLSFGDFDERYILWRNQAIDNLTELARSIGSEAGKIPTHLAKVLDKLRS